MIVGAQRERESIKALYTKNVVNPFNKKKKKVHKTITHIHTYAHALRQIAGGCDKNTRAMPKQQKKTIATRPPPATSRHNKNKDVRKVLFSLAFYCVLVHFYVRHQLARARPV